MRFAGAFRILACSACCGLLPGPAAGEGSGATGVSERDYFGELPVVLSVTRLAQPLNEVPGAVTVIDRELIRRSGARDLAEVLRLVPGFLLTYRNGANPQASYHAGMDVYGSRMQVYVDGRSLYSSFYLGDTHVALRGIVLEEVERIEVLRGSNSASYGANAFLGVVNIVTRNAADTHGATVSIARGEAGVDDATVRYGWGDEKSSYRLTAARRRDRGFNNVVDDSRMSRLQFRGDLTPNAVDDIQLQFGVGEVWRDEGIGTGGNPFRSIGNEDAHLSLRWQRQLAPDEQFQLRFVHERERPVDSFIAVQGANRAVADAGGRGERTELGLQHSLRLDQALRLAWGGEWRYETARSPGLYFTSDKISLHQWRVFGNLEWRPHPQWLLQAGGTHEGHSYTGSALSPRLTASFHVLPEHTLRAGVTRSVRAPTFYELRGDTRLFLITAPATQAAWTFLSSGTVKPESLISHELGYLGRFRDIGLTLDVRAFLERMNNRIWFAARSVPGWPVKVNDAINRPGPHIHGFEYQADWRPFAATRLLLAEAHVRVERGDASETREAPFRNSTLTWLQQLPGQLDLSAIYTTATSYQWAGGGETIDKPRRLDLRLAKAFAFGATRGEFSVTAQGVDGGHSVYKVGQRFDRRSFATLRLDF